MGMVIKNNMAAQQILGELNRNSNKLGKSLKKVSSGMKINSAADDASGYAISERMRVQVRGLDQDINNTQSARSMMRTAEGAISSTVDILRTLKQKAIDAANDTNTDADRATIQKEVDQSIDQIDDNANVTFNGKILFDGAADHADTTEQTIIKALNSEWIDSSLQLIKDTYGLSFEEDDTTVNEITVKFANDDDNTLAYVRNKSRGGKAMELELVINLKFYESLNRDDPNGSTTAAGAGYLDRTLAHEFTHALMAANIDNFNNLPLYIKEGAAEFTHGIDDERRVELRALTKDTLANKIDNSVLNSTQDSSNDPYNVGYTFLHYINAQGGRNGAMQRFMTVLNENGAGALDDAIAAATLGKFTSVAAAKERLLSDIDAAGSMDAFFKNYCDIDLDRTGEKDDTGAVTGSKTWGGDTETAVTIVPEGMSTKYWYYPDSSTSRINGLTVNWPGFSRPDSGFRFQVGTKANQVIKASFSDVHAEALGLKSKEGKTVSIQTRADAKRALRTFDKAIDKALNQQTTIGALQSRLEYTESNLTTASENVQSSESTIRDANMAKEMTEYTKNNVLMQASQSMLAQANQSSSAVLSLLQ